MYYFRPISRIFTQNEIGGVEEVIENRWGIVNQ